MIIQPSVFRTLTPTQEQDLRTLVRLCEQNADVPLYYDFDDTSDDFGMERFFFYYNGSELVHAAYLTVMGEDELDLYLFTHPDFRRRGYCWDALNRVRTLLTSLQNHPPVYLPLDPANSQSPAILKALGLNYSYSDYIMEKTPADIPSTVLPENCRLEIETVKITESGYQAEYKFRLMDFHAGKRSEIGYCLVSFSAPVGTEQTAGASVFCFLSHVTIKKRYRNRGFGTLLVSCVLNYLAELRFSPSQLPVSSVQLHVDSRNLPAVRLYQKLQFQVTEQIDMWDLL